MPLSRHASSVLPVLLLLEASAVLLSPLPVASAYTPHAPIVIIGDADFSGANGVTGGDGSPSSPFVIEGWEIASSGNAIEIRDTFAHFVVRNVSAAAGWFSAGVLLTNIQNGTVSSVNASGGEAGVSVDASRNVVVTGSNLTYNNHDVLVSYSSNVTVIGNVVTGSRGVGITAQWSSDVEITGNNVSGAPYWAIYGFYSANLTITGNNVTAAQGIATDFVTGAVVANNRVVGSTDHAIRTIVSDRILVTDNLLEQSTRWGMYIGSTTNLTIRGNTVANNTEGGIMLATNAANLTGNVLISNGVYLGAFSGYPSDDHTITPDNLVNGKPLRYYAKCGGLSIDGDALGQLLIANCTDVQVRNLQVVDTDVAVELAFVTNASVSTSSFEANSLSGIEAWYSTGVRLESNTIRSFGLRGIEVGYSSAFSIRSNVVSGTMYGVVAGERDGIVEANNITADREAITIGGSRNLILRNNTVSALHGVRVGDSSDFNVTGNQISSTGGTGVRMDWGSSGRLVDNCIVWNVGEGALVAGPIPGIVVYGNSFIDNTVHAVDWDPRLWDNGYPVGGNYWSDYLGTDSMSGPNQNLPGSDGFGDTPYSVDADSLDRYPRMTTSCLRPSNNVAPTVTVTDTPDPANETTEAVWIYATVIDDLDLVSVVKVNITDPVGSEHGNLTMNPWFEDTWSYVSTYVPVGVYLYTVWASDVSGNWGSASGNFTILASAPDNRPPAVVNNRLDGSFAVYVSLNQSVLLTATIDDVLTGTSAITDAWYTMDGGPQVPMFPTDGAYDSALEDVNATIVATAYGTHSICVYGRDVADNVGTVSSCNVLGVNTPPVAAFVVYPESGYLTDVFIFESVSSDPDGFIVVEEWAFDDNGTATGTTVTHQFGTRGTHRFSLAVMDIQNEWNWTEGTVEVLNRRPSANAGSDQTVSRLSLTTLQGTGFDADGDALFYAWAQVGGPSVVLVGADTASPSFIPSEVGLSSFSLTVNDGLDSSVADWVNVTVENARPTVVIAVLPSSVGYRGLEFTFDGTDSTDGDGGIESWAWDFGDGSNGTGAIATHAYGSLGSFAVVLTVVDSDGASASATVAISVVNRAPVIVSADPGDPTVRVSADQARVFAVVANDPDEDPLEYIWSLEGIIVGTGSSVSVSCGPGTYRLNVTVSDGQDVASQVWTIHVSPRAMGLEWIVLGGMLAVTLLALLLWWRRRRASTSDSSAREDAGTPPSDGDEGLKSHSREGRAATRPLMRPRLPAAPSQAASVWL